MPISSLTGECSAQKLKTFAVLVFGHVYIGTVYIRWSYIILRSRNKITDFLMILAWASPFNILAYYF